MTSNQNTSGDWWTAPAPTPDSGIRQQAFDRQNQLTKPPGSLGRLEDMAIRLAAIQHQLTPSMEQVQVSVFAGDHGIVDEGVSAFPQAVTVEMQRNFIAGGAAISVLCREVGATLEVVNAGTRASADDLPGVIHCPVAPRTANFLREDAMNSSQWQAAMDIGQQAAIRAHDGLAHLFIGGEMGIGNTTAATAILSALCGIPVTSLTGPGTGLDRAGVKHKANIIEQALEHHRADLVGAEAISRIVGGFEIVALSGAYIAAAQRGIAVLVDGFICTAAAAVALQLNPSVSPYFFYSHCSAEPGHRAVLDHLGVRPIVDLNMRLGEGSGAATLVPMLRMACALHNSMATFDEAAVSGKADSNRPPSGEAS